MYNVIEEMHLRMNSVLIAILTFDAAPAKHPSLSVSLTDNSL